MSEDNQDVIEFLTDFFKRQNPDLPFDYIPSYEELVELLEESELVWVGNQDKHRWTTHSEVVKKVGGRYIYLIHEEGNTEYQEIDGSAINLSGVRFAEAIEVVKTIYKPINNRRTNV